MWPCSSSINPSAPSSSFISSVLLQPPAVPPPPFIYLSFNPVIHPLPLCIVSITSIITTAPCWASYVHLSSLPLRGTHEEEKEMEMLSGGERCGAAERGEFLDSEWLVCQEGHLQHPLLTWEVTIYKEECVHVLVCKWSYSHWFMAGCVRVNSSTHSEAQQSSCSHWISTITYCSLKSIWHQCMCRVLIVTSFFPLLHNRSFTLFMATTWRQMLVTEYGQVIMFMFCPATSLVVVVNWRKSFQITAEILHRVKQLV